ncbi:N-acetylmuramoyl-L-alanine amidase, partial [Bacillus altitudinis]|uniref:N-acetylmuramoyl-L-alanine amidase n=1 Tax=Bacillus altitudinis TaxID=293387 RepID=UPI0016438F49
YPLYDNNLNLHLPKPLNTNLNNAPPLLTISTTSHTFHTLQTPLTKPPSANPHIFITVHPNSNHNTTPNPTQTYYHKTYPPTNTFNLPQNIHPKILTPLPTTHPPLNTPPFYLIKYSNIPTLLLQTPFLSTP